MKKVTLLLLSILLLLACNSKKDDQIKNADIPQQEKELFKSIETYPDSFLL